MISKWLENHINNFVDRESHIPHIFNPFNEQEYFNVAPTLTCAGCGTFGCRTSIIIIENKDEEERN